MKLWGMLQDSGELSEVAASEREAKDEKVRYLASHRIVVAP